MEEDLKIADLEIDIPTHMSNCMVADLVEESGNWQISELQQWLPSDIIAKIIAIPAPQEDYGNDVSVWPGGKSGDFSISYTYNAMCGFITSDRFDKCYKV